MRALVTGGAGFIGSHLDEALLKNGYDVVAIDIYKKETCRNIAELMKNHAFTYCCQDATDTDSLKRITKGCDIVFHLAANSDIRAGGVDPNIDYERTLLTTRSVLETVRTLKIKKMFFSSTSAVYGNMGSGLNEKTGGLQPISYYGAAKLASESLISAYSYMNDFDALVFRFPNVIGPRLTHGVIFDFVRKLKKDPTKLEILGDGSQSKQYVHVCDLVSGIIDFSNRMKKGYSLYNISTESYTDVKTIADLTCARMGLSDVRYEYTGGNVGWKGDVPTFGYDVSKAKAEGWKYRYDSTEAVRATLNELDLDQISSL
jgi:UDP-glucose 4-epimerase